MEEKLSPIERTELSFLGSAEKMPFVKRKIVLF